MNDKLPDDIDPLMKLMLKDIITMLLLAAGMVAMLVVGCQSSHHALKKALPPSAEMFPSVIAHDSIRYSGDGFTWVNGKRVPPYTPDELAALFPAHPFHGFCIVMDGTEGLCTLSSIHDLIDGTWVAITNWTATVGTNYVYLPAPTEPLTLYRVSWTNQTL